MRFPVINLSFPLSNIETQNASPNQAQIALAADVFFDFDKSDLTPIAKQLLSKIAPQIAANAKGPVDIDGYTDSIGDASYNQTLSQARADAVKAFLAQALASGPGGGPQLVATGHGATDFVAPNTNPDGTDNPSGRAQNRRVTITYPTS